MNEYPKDMKSDDIEKGRWINPIIGIFKMLLFVIILIIGFYSLYMDLITSGIIK